MAKDDLTAGPATLLELLKSEKQYTSPLFQRQYVWGNRELDALWANVDEILEGSESARFLGALVLEVDTAGLAFRPDRIWIVDGQQRITTLFMILLSIAAVAAQNGKAGRDIATWLYQQCLFNQGGGYRNQPKVVPTLRDTTQFNNLFRDLPLAQPRLRPNYGPEDGKLERASKSIRRAVRDRCFTDGHLDSTATEELVSVLLERLKFVQIVLGDDEDPHQVFDSLNSEGIRLENKDLIRNLVFHRLADQPQEAETVYHQNWLPIEDRLNERFDKYFFPFTLIHKPSVTKSRLLSTLRQRWNDWTPNAIMDDLNAYVPMFDALTSETEQSRERYAHWESVYKALKLLYRMPVPSSTYPFVMRVLYELELGALDERDATANLRLIESFLVRRAFAGFEPTGLHAVFKNLWHDTSGDPERFIEVIDKNPTVMFPDDDEFVQSVMGKPLYGRRLARYILLQHELALPGGDPLPPDIEFTIDHVIPQTLSESWSTVISPEVHEQLKDTWANLVPLTVAANAEKGRALWPEIQRYYQTETIFKTTKRLVNDYDTWDEHSIIQRANRLAQWALLRWPKASEF